MVTKVEIARHLGITKMHAGRLVKRGCPMTSLKAAKVWRDANPPKRAATTVKVTAPKVTQPPKAKKPAAKSSRINPRAAEKSRKATTKPVGGSKGPPEPEKAVLPARAEKSGDSLLDALNAAIHVHEVSLSLFDYACKHSPITIPARLSEHTRALTARFTAEESYRKELQHRKVLINKDEAFQTARQVVEAILKRLRRMPIEVGPQCNPQESLRATKILQKSVDEIIATGSKEVHAIRAAREQR